MKIGRIIQAVLSTTLVVAGVALLATPYVRDYRMDRRVAAIEQSLEAMHEDDASVPGSSDAFPEQSEESSDHQQNDENSAQSSSGPNLSVYSKLYQEFEAYNQRLNTEGQAVSDAWSGSNAPDMLAKYGLDALGIVEIPDMKVKLPLYVNTTEEHLANGAAVMTGTSMPIGGANTNCVIAAHRGWRGNAYFQFIDRMVEGSLVYVHTPWETLTYRAVDATVVNPQDSEKVLIQEGKDMLTLVSCHPYVIGGGPERYLVFCERVTELSDGQSESSVQKDEVPTETPSVDTKVPAKPLGPVDKKDDVLNLEVLVQQYLPPITLLFCGILILVRVIRGRKH